MPTDGYERELARSVDAVGEGDECPDCGGVGELYWPGVTSKCQNCKGTGYITEHDAMDDGDALFERSTDR